LAMRTLSAFVVVFVTSLSGSPGALATDAEQIYYNTCIVCHGDDGTGNMPGVPDLSTSGSLFTDSEQAIVARMKSGIQKPGGIAMPPRGGSPTLTDRQLLEVLRYLKQIVKQ